MWRGAVLFSLVICHTTSQPLEGTKDNGRSARQLDLGECCPCPDRTSSRASSVDDCPCRPRSTDSEGASSLFFPTVLPRRPFPSADSKEDSKNLLNPEVDLATSVLETLRDVTDEEYQDALARDAARAAKADFEGSRDASGAESGRNHVTIIVSPKESDSLDDVLSEASHVQETRCISPLGSNKSKFAKLRKPLHQPSNILKEILMFPKPKPLGLLHGNLMDLDSDIGASNVKERVAHAMDDMNTRIGARLNNRPLLKLFHNDIDISNTLSSKPKSDIDCNEITVTEPSKLNSLPSTRNVLTTSSKLRSTTKPLHLKKEMESRGEFTDDAQSIDLSEAPSNIEKQIIEDGREINSLVLGSGTLNKGTGNSLFLQRKANQLKKLVKLKDVELIPPVNSRDRVGLNIPKINLGLIKKPSLFAKSSPTGTLSDLISNGIKFNFNKLNSMNDSKIKSSNVNSVTQNGNHVSDALPSASNDIRQFRTKTDNCENDAETDPQIRLVDKINDDTADVASSALEEPINIPSSDIRHTDESITENCEINTENNAHLSLRDQIIDEKIADAAPSASENHSNIILTDTTNVDDALSTASIDNSDVNHELIQEADSVLPKGIEEEGHEQMQDENIVNKHTDNEVEDELEESDSINNITSTSTDCVMQSSQDTRAELNDDNDNQLIPEAEIEPELIQGDEHMIVNDEANINQRAIKNLSPISKALSNIRENVLETLGNLRKPSAHVIMKSQNDDGQTLEENGDKPLQERSFLHNSPDSVDKNPDLITEPNTHFATNYEETTPISSGTVTIEDLEKLSNSILNLSSQNEGETIKSKEDTKTSELIKIIKPETVEEVTKSSQPIDSKATISLLPINSMDQSVERHPEDRTCLSDNNSPMKHDLDKTVTGGLNGLKSSSNDGTKLEEMDVEASDPIINVLSQDPLNLFDKSDSFLTDIIGQPPSLPSLDVSNLGLPTLDDLKSSLSILNIFDANDREVGTERSDENSGGELSPEMIGASSSPIFQSQKLPVVKQLEDVNLDIFKSKPSTRIDFKFNPLNLHSTKLSAPNTLDLKPMKWKSTLGNKGGLLSMDLNTSPNSRMNKPVLRSEKIVSNFDDMRESMRSNVQSLINKDVLPRVGSLGEISDDIKEHAEDALRNVQKTMKSLKQRPVSDINVFRNSFKKPQDILDLASRTRDDVEDKLKALHYDFNDRVTTMHENLLEQSRLVPLHRSLFTDYDRKLRTKLNRPTERIFTTPSKPLLERQNFQSKKKSNDKLLRTTEIPLAKGKTKVDTMFGASSVPLSKTVEQPELKSRKLPFFKQNLKMFEPKEVSRFDKKSKPELSQSFYKSNFPKKNTVEITFSTTPRSTLISATRNILADDKDRSANSGSDKSPLERSRIKPLRSSFLKDSNGSPSDFSPIEVTASSSRGGDVNSNDERLTTPSFSDNLEPITKLRTSPSLFRQSLKDNVNNSRPIKIKIKPPTLEESTVIENPKQSKGSKSVDLLPRLGNNFLSKLRDAVNARLSSLDPILTPSEAMPVLSSPQIKMIPSGSDVDMSRSASENLETIVNEPLKENVSYKCRMVCTKE